MTYKQGRFYNDQGEVVPLEFGNRQQIEIINQIDGLRKGASVHMHIITKKDIICPCGGVIPKPESVEDIEECTTTCPCGQVYEFFSDEDYGLPCIRMKAPKKTKR